jgi:hypothetical protein
MKKLSISALLLMTFMVMSFTSSPRTNEDLLGKWLYEIQDYKVIIEFKQDGSYAVDMNLEDDITNVTGNYQINNQELILEDVSGENACIGDIGKYTYKVEGDKLMLTVVSDDCSGRKGMMSSVPHAKKVK